MFDNQPLVSIVMPIYNQQAYLSRSLRDACNQNYHKIEIVAVNDGSTDDSLDILRQASNEDNPIVVVNQANGGLIAANVAGIKNASGEYICFVDPDDRIGPDFVESFVQLLDGEYDFVAQGFVYKYPDRVVPFPLRNDSIFNESDLRQLADSYILDSKLALDNTIFVARWNKMYKRDCLNSFVNEYFESKRVSLGEDSLFTYLLLMHASSAKVCARICSYQYVQHERSMMRSNNWHRALEKTQITYSYFSEIVSRYPSGENAAYYLLYALGSGLLGTTMRSSYLEGRKLYRNLQADEAYKHSVKLVVGHSGMHNVNALLQYIGVPSWLYALARGIYSFFHK